MLGQLRLEEEWLPPFQAFDDWTIVPNSFTINKTKDTNKIVFVSLDSNVDTDQFSLELYNCSTPNVLPLPDRLCNERRIEETRFDNGLKIFKITKLDEGIIFLRNKVLFDVIFYRGRLDMFLRVLP